MSDPNEVVRVLEAIKRLSPEHRQRAESVAVVVEQALASAQTTIATLERRIAELEARPVASAGLIEAADLFDKLHIRHLLDEWFAGPNPTNVDALADVLRMRLARAADRSGK